MHYYYLTSPPVLRGVRGFGSGPEFGLKCASKFSEIEETIFTNFLILKSRVTFTIWSHRPLFLRCVLRTTQLFGNCCTKSATSGPGTEEDAHSRRHSVVAWGCGRWAVEGRNASPQAADDFIWRRQNVVLGAIFINERFQIGSFFEISVIDRFWERWYFSFSADDCFAFLIRKRTVFDDLMSAGKLRVMFFWRI